MESLIFSLNATVPVFLMMVLGVVFRKLGWFDRDLAKKINSFVFHILLPMLLFQQLAEADLSQLWDGRFVLFCLCASSAAVAASWLLGRLWRDRSVRAEFIQASFRGNTALLGVALLQNMYGDAQAAPLMLLGCVPLYNVMAVVVLSLLREGEGETPTVGRTVRDILTNPILIAIVLGLAWSALGLTMPPIMAKTVGNLAGMASPLGLMSIGATFEMKRVLGRSGPVAAAAGLKLVGFCAVLLPVAVLLGFRGQELAAICIMLGSSTAVSSYVMAVAMGHEGVITSGAVMLTTLLSGFTLTGWVWLMRALGLI